MIDPQQSQETVAVGIQDDTLLKIVRGYATVEAGFVQQQQTIVEQAAEIRSLRARLEATSPDSAAT